MNQNSINASTRSTKSAGLVSVVIPCRNEANAIERTLAAIFASDYDDLEVLVVDGMSDDSTRQILSRLQSVYGDGLRIIDNPHKLTPFAFNLGVKNAKGRFIQIIGSRNIIARDYITILVNALEANPGWGCVGGDYQHVFDNESSRFIANAMESKFGMGGGNYRTMSGDTEVDTVGVPLYRRSIFNEIGLFDENLSRNQDDEFNYRLRASGSKIFYVHQAKVTYLVRSSLKKAFMQFFQYGYFKVFVSRKHRTLTTFRQIIPALFVLFLVLAPIAIAFYPIGGMVSLTAVLSIYCLLGITLSGRGLTLGQRLGVLRVCFVLHLAYGLGFLQGIWDFLICGRRPRATFQRQTV